MQVTTKSGFAAQPIAPQYRKVAPQFGKEYKALIAEDNPQTQSCHSGYVQGAYIQSMSGDKDTFEVFPVASATEGKKVLDREDIDLLLTDNNMEGGNEKSDGIELLEYAKTVKHPPRWACMISSPIGMSAEALEKQAKDAGADKFYNKNDYPGFRDKREMLEDALTAFLKKTSNFLGLTVVMPKAPSRPGSRAVSRHNSEERVPQIPKDLSPFLKTSTTI